MSINDRCIFCKIARKEDDKTSILFEDEEFVAFQDIRPAAKHHYLIITKQHIKDPKQLKADDLPLLERLIATGETVLKNQGSNDDTRYGFHWPPFTSINHLHLHVISPTSSMGFLSKVIFKENSYWFVSAKWLSDRLKKMKDEEPK